MSGPAGGPPLPLRAWGWLVRGLGFGSAAGQAASPPAPPPEPAPADDPLAYSRQLVRTVGWAMGIASLGPEPRLEMVNAAFARMLGHAPEDWAGVPAQQCLAPACWVALATARAQALVSGSAQVELSQVHRDGHALATLASLTAVRDAQGEPHHILFSVQDIGALKRAEQQALDLATRLHAVLDAMPVGVWIGDAQGAVELTNPAVRALGLDRGDQRILGRGDHESLMRRAAITGQTVRSGLRSVPGGQGAVREVQVTAGPILDARGRVVGALAVDEDQTEVRRSAQALVRSNAMLERIFNACTVGMALVDAGGQVRRCNVAWRLQVDALEGQSLLAALAPGDLLAQRDLLGAVARGERSGHAGEGHLRRPDGTPGWISFSLSRLPGERQAQGEGEGEGAQVLVQVADIETRRRADEELVVGRLQLAAAQRMAGMGEWQLDVDHGLLTCSNELLHLIGCGPSSHRVLPRQHWIERMPAEDQTRFTAAVDQALNAGERLSLDTRLRRPDGQEMVVHLHAVMQRSGQGRVLAGTLQDVTQRKRIEDALRHSREQLRALVAYEDKLIEEERKRIAREVHDELGQLVTALRMDLSMLCRDLPLAGEALRRAERMRETMATMSNVVRHVASHLRPGALDMGLVAAIEWLAEDFSLRWETRCTLDLPHEQEPRLPEAVALALFRAVQESLTNIARHAQATQVTIRLVQRATLLQLTVSDNGRGFDPQAVADRRGGLGLLGMRERMLAIGAGLDIATGPAGTVVDILYDMERSITTP